jgi:hypothetical protein
MLEPLLSPDTIRGMLIQHYGNDDHFDCFVQMNNFTTNLLKYPFWQMVEFSAKDTADIGDPTGCNKISESAHYVVENTYVDVIPG